VDRAGEAAGRATSSVIEIVFFDAGETLLHPHPSFPELFSATCARHGIDVSPEEVAPVLFGMVRNMAEVAAEAGVANASASEHEAYRFWTHVYRRCLAELSIEAEWLADELYKVFSDGASYRLYDDALPAIEALKDAGYRIGLISNFEGWLEELLVELELGDVFEVSVISGLVGVEKPNARIYEIALDQAGVDPGVAAHVGDSLPNDIQPPVDLGMKAVLLDRAGRHGNEKLPVIRSLLELPAVIPTL
jgi:putative hydrolase of the HAD superfamily